MDVEQRLLDSQRIAWGLPQQLQRFGGQADFGFWHKIARMGIENQLLRGQGLRIGPGRAENDAARMSSQVEVHVDFVARQPGWPWFAGLRIHRQWNSAYEEGNQNAKCRSIDSIAHSAFRNLHCTLAKGSYSSISLIF